MVTMRVNQEIIMHANLYTNVNMPNVSMCWSKCYNADNRLPVVKPNAHCENGTFVYDATYRNKIIITIITSNYH